MIAPKTIKSKLIWLVTKCALFLGLSTVIFANPVLNNIVSGNVSVQQSGNTLQVNQKTEKGIVAWDSFNIKAGEKTQFNQPNSSAITLNRINPQQGASRIFGQLVANGSIILINGAGLYFGSGAMVNVGSIIVSTSNITNANFLAGKYVFDEPYSYGGAIINQGTITAADMGVVALLGAVVENDGLIRARLGSIALGSGDEFTLDFSGDQLITFAVTAPATRGHVTNTGKLLANGGQVFVTASVAAGVLDNVINMSGYAEARSSAASHDGSIVLSANNGDEVVDGKFSPIGQQDGSDNLAAALNKAKLVVHNTHTATPYVAKFNSHDYASKHVVTDIASSTALTNVKIVKHAATNPMLIGMTINTDFRTVSAVVKTVHTVAANNMNVASNKKPTLNLGSLVGSEAMEELVASPIKLNSVNSKVADNSPTIADFSILVKNNSVNAVNPSAEKPAIVNDLVSLDGVPTNLAEFNAKNSSSVITMAADADTVVSIPSPPPSSSKSQVKRQQANLITSYTNYVNNVSPVPPKTVFMTNHIIVNEVTDDCAASNQNASVDNENNITLSQSCTP